MFTLFIRWKTSYLQNKDYILQSDWTAEFSADIFNEFMIMVSLIAANMDGTPTHDGKSITSAKAQTISSSFDNMRIEIKSYPVFNGQIKD